MNNQADQPIETLRLTDREKAQLLKAIDELTSREAGKSQRRLRVSCDHTRAVLSLVGQAGSATRFVSLVRNISRWGASLVHGRYVYPDTRCEVQLRAMDGTEHVRVATVRYCRHVKGLVHEVGIAFDEPIDLSLFTDLSPSEESRHLQELAEDMPADEAEHVSDLAYRVLVVDDYACDRKLYTHWLSRAGMTVAAVTDAAGARERVQETQFDLLIVDARLGRDCGAELIRSLRGSSFVAPILAVSAEEDEQTKSAMLSAGASQYLNKPFNAETLVQTVRGLMGVGDGEHNTPIFSDLNDDQGMRPLLTEFTRGLSDSMDKLREANARQDFDTLEQIGHALKGAGSGYGFSPISAHAERLLFSLNESAADIEKIKHAANDLLSILNRVKVR